MTNPVTPVPISPLPDAPLITDTPAVFNDKAFPFAQALDPFGDQINAIAIATNTNAVAAKEGETASAVSASASAASAVTAAGSVTDAAAQVTLAVDAKDSAWNAAAAAGAAAGLPVYAGKAGLSLVVKNDETGVAWNSAGFQIGGVYAGAVKPTLGVWVETDKFYFKAAYPMLSAALGTIPAVAPWTQRTQAALTQTRGLAYGNGVWVAVGYNNSSAPVGASSPDGVTWTARTVSAVNAVTFGNGLFVAVGNGAQTSPDGVAWTTRGIPPSDTWLAVTFANGLFVAISALADGIATSTDGITWTRRTVAGISGLIAVSYGSGRFVVLNQTGGGATSSDGISWTPFSAPPLIIYGLAYGNGVFVAVGSAGALTSPDGITWTSRPMPGIPVAPASYQAVAYYNGRFIAVGSETAGNPLFADSPDGITWTQRFMPSGGYRAILAAAGLIVAAGTLMQTAPMFPYNTETEFYVPAPLGVVALKSWMKASDAGGQGPGNQEDYLAQVVGTGANQISANGMLGRQAFLDAVGEITPMLSRPATKGVAWFESANDTTLTICMRGYDGVVRVSSPITLS